MIEQQIEELKELKRDESPEFEPTRDRNLQDYEDLPDEKLYYIRLYAEVFEDKIISEHGSNLNLTPQDRLQIAYQTLEEARETRGNQVTKEQFKTITQYSSLFDEVGTSFDESQEDFFIDKRTGKIKEMPFDEMIRDHVFKLLKYRGSFKSMIRSKYFIQDSQKNEFYFSASHKIPFYFIYESCTQIKTDLMKKYLENPINPMIFVSYDQLSQELQKEEIDYSKVPRTIHMDIAYSKFKRSVPVLMCVGNPATYKSTLLNDMFGTQFETIQEGSACLFHDSIDAIFDSKDVPIGFNVFDFQGAIANNDYKMIEYLLTKMPQTYLLIQVSDRKYIDNVIRNISGETRKKFFDRVYVISKAQTPQINLQIKRGIRDCFPGFVEKSNFLPLGDAQAGQAKYLDACQSIFEFFKSEMNSRAEVFRQEVSNLEQEMNSQRRNVIVEEYKRIYGFYWLLADSFNSQIQEAAPSTQLKVINKGAQFRASHMKTKKIIFGISDQKLLSRKQMFPMYILELEKMKIEQELSKRDLLAAARISQLEREKEKLKLARPMHGTLFKIFKQLYLAEELESVDDFLELIEASYLPRLSNDFAKIKEFKAQVEKINQEIFNYEESPDKIRQNSTVQQTQEYDALKDQRLTIKRSMDEINSSIEDKVLDSELFLRELKQCMLSEPQETQGQFQRILAQSFENGRPMEIVDGDIDAVERTSLAAVMDWVCRQIQNHKKLLVVTILGPQSSGKSTLLNFLVGAKFHVSAGRCTKGLNAMLLRTDFEETKEILILDSEGIFSIERNDPKYDRRLAIFCMTVSNLLLINIKGELNVEIEKVLQVSIYALKRIATVQTVLRKTKIRFILRDQIEQGTQAMETAFKILKNSLMQAAQAAGAKLDEMIEIPEQASDIITIFPSALSLEQINENKNFVHIRSSDIFRQQCSLLRLELLNMAKSLPHESRVANLIKWAQDATNVWTAVQENDDLVMIRDLNQINDHRNLVTALDQFRKIMSKSAPINAENQQIQYHQNPLLTGTVPEELQDEKMIAENKTIFAEFDKKIEEGLLEQKNLKKTDSRDAFIERKKQDFVSLREDFENKYCDQARLFSEQMGPILAYQAENSVKKIVYSIWQKAMNKWQDKQASATIENSLSEMYQKLKDIVFQAKLSNQVISSEQFGDEIKRISRETREKIKSSFFQSADEIRQQAIAEFHEIREKVNKAEETKGGDDDPSARKPNVQVLQSTAPCLQQREICETELESTNDDELDEELARWAWPNDTELHPLINQYIMYKDVLFLSKQRELERISNQIKEKGGVLNWAYQEVKNFFSQRSDAKKQQQQERSDAAQEQQQVRVNKNTAKQGGKKGNKGKKGKNVANASRSNAAQEQQQELIDENEQDQQEKTRLEEWLSGYFAEQKAQITSKSTFEIRAQIRDRWKQLQRQILDQDEEISQYNSEHQKVQNLPEEFVLKYIAIFNCELDQQRKDMATPSSVQNVNEFRNFIQYNQSRYISSFNAILFNQLWKQGIRNQELLFSEVQLKIEQTEQEAKEFHTKINSQIDSDSGAAEEFLDLIANTLITILRKNLLDQFDSMMYQVDSDISKEDIMKEATQTFENAYDYETIIMHMTKPVELERQIFRSKYHGMQSKFIQNIKDKFEYQVSSAMKVCQEFIDLVIAAFLDKGEQSPDIEANQIQDFLEYLYGNIMQYIAKDLTKSFLGRRRAVEGYSWFDKYYSLPPFTKTVMTIEGEREVYSQQMLADDSNRLKLLAPNIRTLSHFLGLAKFQNTSKNSKLGMLIAKHRQSLHEDLKSAEKAMKNFEHAQTQAMGCMAECFFCGARCVANQSCEENKTHHKTNFHRPMAFKGSYEIQAGRKVLLKDFCTSHYNLNESRWPKPPEDLNDIQKLLQRLSKDYSCDTEAMNVYLEWSTGSDLDINVMCGCGKWHGYGTEGGSGGSCRCETCHMYRDHDITTGEDGRTGVFEHVYFKKPELVYGKQIGMAVHNFSQRSSLPQNDFKMALINRHGYQLYPNRGGAIVQQGWMFCSSSNKSFSEKKFYDFTQGDDKLGQELNSDNFIVHANVTSQEGQKWEFNPNEAASVKNGPEFVRYRNCWQQKWQIVNDFICGPDYFDSDLLDSVCDV